jgi:DNA-binding transcriptional LysR family regulator
MLNAAQLARIDLNLLVLFSVVLEEGHVARAAGRLSLTPSAVSHGLGRLRRLLNDPLFLRTPRGVVPTDRARRLAEPVAEIMARVGSVIATAAPFDPATSRRRFMIGAPDGASAVVLAPLMARLDKQAPGIDIGLAHLMPEQSIRTAAQSWRQGLEMLEARTVDIAVLPLWEVPPRFVARRLYEEDFVVAMRKGHAFARDPSLSAFCRMGHLLVSLSGDPSGFVDDLLAKRGLTRRVTLTVPSFMMALAHLASSDLIASLPRHLVQRHGRRFGLIAAELPLKRKPDPIQLITTKAALIDAGVSWLMGIVAECTKDQPISPARRRPPGNGLPETQA